MRLELSNNVEVVKNIGNFENILLYERPMRQWEQEMVGVV